MTTEDLFINVHDEVKADDTCLRVGRVSLSGKKLMSFLFSPVKGKALRYYPIIRMDRSTVQEILPLFAKRGIFSNYSRLRTDEAILEAAKLDLNKSELTFEEERQILSQAGEYRSNGYVVKDYGNYAIGFSAKLYIEYIAEAESELKAGLLAPSLFPETNENVRQALKKIRLYVLAHKIAYIILAEVYSQRTSKGVVIPKRRLLHFLGYEPKNKQIYQDIKEVLVSLRWLDYRIYDYSSLVVKKKKMPHKESSKSVGNFIYNIKEEPTSFILHVNEAFVGCISKLLVSEQTNKKDRRELFSSGYFKYPTSVIPLIRDYSDAAYFLTQFLVSERGNRHLNQKNLKVISYQVKRYVHEAHINHKRASRRYRDFLNALQEIEIIENIEPSMADLKKMKPQAAFDANLRVWTKHPVEELDRHIETKLVRKSNLPGALISDADAQKGNLPGAKFSLK